jgi:hypothetical protein
MSAVVVVMSRRRRRLIRAYLNAGATDPMRACTPQELGLRRSWIFDRLIDRGVFVPIADGRCFLDLDATDRYFRARRRGAVVVALIAIGVLLFLVAST